MLSDITVLMTGAGAPGAPGIISCYKKNGERSIRVVGVDMNPEIPTKLMLDSFYQIPKADSPDFIDKIIEIVQIENVNVIQPLVTRELTVFAQEINRFEEINVPVCVAPIDVLRIANNKGSLLDSLSSNGIEVPQYIRVHTIEQFIDACKKLGYPEKPVCFKPCISNGSRGFRIIDNSINRFSLLFDYKPSSTYMLYEDAINILSASVKFPELLVMEYLPGDEYSVDLLADGNELIYCVPRLRLSMNGGISTKCITKNETAIIEYCRSVVKILHLRGNIGIQVRLDADRKIKILEINPRVQGSIVNCAAAGVNLPYLGIKQALGEALPEITPKWNVMMVRYWSEIYYDSDGYAFAY